MKVVASYLTQQEALRFSRAYPNAEICLMSTKLGYSNCRNEVANKPFWCVQV